MKTNISHADYARWWREHPGGTGDGCPSAPTAEAIWSTLAAPLQLQPRDLIPASSLDLDDYRLPIEDRERLTLTVKQAFAVALDVAVSAGRPSKKDKPGRLPRLVTFTTLADAIAQRWSPTYRAVRNKTGAGHLRDMREDTVKEIRREVSLSGIFIPSLWKIITKHRTPLFKASLLRRQAKQSKRTWTGGYRVTLQHGPALADFEVALEGDREYRPPARTLRLRLRGDKLVPVRDRPVEQRVCEEVPYDVVPVTERAAKVITILESAPLLFNARRFMRDYKRCLRDDLEYRRSRSLDVPMVDRKGEHSSTLRLSINRTRWQRRAHQVLATYGRVYAQLQALGPGAQDTRGFIPIRTEFFRAVNRRYHARSLGLEQVKSKARARWFAFEGANGEPLPMQGFDVSSSETQIKALLLGLTDLEAIARPGAPKPFKETFADLLWAAHEHEGLPLYGISGPDDPALVTLGKAFWMPHGYGADLRRIVWKHEERFLPKHLRKSHSWETEQRQVRGRFVVPTNRELEARKRERDAAVAHAVTGLERFLTSLPWFGDHHDGKLRSFLEVCRLTGDRAPAHLGATFTDPLDGAEIVWNPVRRAPKKLRQQRSPALRLLLAGRLHQRTGAFLPIPPRHGRHAVNTTKLARKITPQLVHTLDACFNALVVEQLAKRGLPVAAVHDAWYTTDTAALADVLTDAARSWFDGLGPVYRALMIVAEFVDQKTLAADAPAPVLYVPMVQRWHGIWKDRATRGEWPAFRAAPSAA